MFKISIGGDDTGFQNHNRLDDASDSTCTFKMTYVRFDSTTEKISLISQAKSV